ncbi:MAG: sulfatase [bacterium]|nr:sulfatase [bacterium]
MNRKEWNSNRRQWLLGAAGSALTLAGCHREAPSDSAGPSASSPVNLLFIVADTFRYDYLGCHGLTPIHTPHLDQLAADSVSFTQCYADGLPTIPARRVFMTGCSVLPDSEWIPLRPEDLTLAEILSPRGYQTGIISDVYHYFLPGMNFHRGFRSFEWIRGQEDDLWKASPRDPESKNRIPAHHWTERYHNTIVQYLRNTRHWRSEEDYFCHRSSQAAIRWLRERQADQPFFLHLDLYDPHEPWDAPPRFQRMVRTHFPLKRYLFGYGINWKDIRPEDIPILRDLYAAEILFVDHCLGSLFQYLREAGLYENTVVVFTSDHGTHLGEDGCVQKRPGFLNSCLTQLPLLIRHPDPRYAGKRIDALVSAMDIAPTLLQLLHIPPPPAMEGLNLWPLVEEQTTSVREELFTAFFSFAAVRTRQWHYFQHYKEQDPGHGPCLYDLSADGEEQWNVYTKHPSVVRDLRSRLQQRFQVPLP